MKAFVLSAAALTLAAVPTMANTSVITLGGPLAMHCYDAAEARNVSREAIGVCDRSLAEEPLTTRDRAATLVNRGILSMVRDQLTEADRMFDRAIALESNLSDAWLNKAFVRLRQGRGREALPLLQHAIDLHARHEALVLYARGIAYEQSGDLKSAYADLQKARELAPGWDEPAIALARYEVKRR